MQDIYPGHIVAIFGGAVAGSEAAHRLVQRGIRCVVFDQDRLPYGKIEHGLPKWHIKLRDKEERQIDERLSHPLVDFVPATKLGRDIELETVLEMGFSAVLLAVGAWRDRPLPVEGVDPYDGRGFYYQNPYVMWFNQYHSPDYDGPQMELADDAIVVGGGLASLDVVKILMLETTLRSLRERGLESDLFTLEKKGIPKVLADLGIAWEDLGLKGCTLFYRRRVLDMPLNEIPSGTAPDKAARMTLVRQKLMDNFQKKFLFRFEPCRVPVDTIIEDQRLAGLVFQRTEVGDDGKARAIEGSEETFLSPLTISSIGSLPEPLPGLPMKWNLLDVEDEDTGKINGFDNLFALGNTVTGRGNIRASLLHGRQVADHVMDHFLAWREEDYQKLIDRSGQQAAQWADRVAGEVEGREILSAEHIGSVRQGLRLWQERVGYGGDYGIWSRENAYTRLETMIGYGS